MTRNLLIGGILALVAFFVWSAGKAPAVPASVETLGPPTLCIACAQATQAAWLQDVMINLSVQQTQSIAAATARSALETPATPKASGFWAQGAVTTPYPWGANTRATAIAVAAAANSADVTRSAVQAQAALQQAGLQRTLAAATQNAAAQQETDQMVSRAATAIALTGLQARTDIAPRPEPSTVLWMWLTPILILVTAVLTLWGVTRWLAQRRTESQPTAPR